MQLQERPVRGRRGAVGLPRLLIDSDAFSQSARQQLTNLMYANGRSSDSVEEIFQYSSSMRQTEKSQAWTVGVLQRLWDAGRLDGKGRLVSFHMAGDHSRSPKIDGQANEELQTS